MILPWLLIITVAGGVIAWLASLWSHKVCRWATLIALAIDLALALNLCAHCPTGNITAQSNSWVAYYNHLWIESLGIEITLAADGLSALLLLLTVFLGLAAVVSSWSEIQRHVGWFHLTVMCTLAGIMGVFISLDLFLFYVFWELMLVPMFFLIVVWGHENRIRAGWKFFIFTQAGGLFLLLAILGLYFAHGRQTGIYTFNYLQLLAATTTGPIAIWLLAGFATAFLIKLPAVPVHTWLPDAHTEAPTAGSVILAGLLLKTGAYGLLRFVLPLFPAAAADFAPAAMVLGTVGILYGALQAFGQSDAKRLVAYTSVSHLGFVLLGIFAFSETAWQGAFLIMIAHGLSTGALFIVVGCLQERIHTRRIDAMGGLWSAMPRMGGVAMFFALASLGLPGLANFVGEFLVLVGTFPKHPIFTIFASLGLVLSAIYSLWLMFTVFFGPARPAQPAHDLVWREKIVFAVLIILIIGIGLFPQPIIDTVKPVFSALQHRSAVNAQNSTDAPHSQTALLFPEYTDGRP
jgi:NADH-quinone oxidoreductase subunit M